MSIAESPTFVVQALRSNPDGVAELLVKNLAMSAAQAVFHRRNQSEEMAQGSERVRQRTGRLIKLVELPSVLSALRSGDCCYGRGQQSISGTLGLRCPTTAGNLSAFKQISEPK